MRYQIASTLLGLASLAYGQTGYTTKNEAGISYSVSVPADTASSGSGDIYIQIQGPSSNSWIGLGQGSSMSGAKMFIIYASADGNNVTLSPRTASGQREPTYDSSAKVELMAGSGISGSTMTANIRCSDCLSKVSATDSSSSWIYAARSGSALKSDKTDATIQQHGSGSYGTMSIDMTAAKATDNNSPFTSSSTTSGTTSTSGSDGDDCVEGQTGDDSASSSCSITSGSSTPTSTSGGGYGPFGGSFTSGGPFTPPWATATGSAKVKRACTPKSGSGSSVSNNGLSGFQALTPEKQTQMLQAHGVLAGLAFAILFPFGAISIRLLSFPGLVWFHAAFQAFAYLTYIAAFGIGVYMASSMRAINQAHPIIGIVLFVVIFFQPIFGILHHNNFKKFAERTGFSYVHIWLGRIIITLGIINGGLGLKWANNSTYGPIVYGVVAGIVWLIYVASIFIGEKRRNRNRNAGPPKYDEAMSTSEMNSPAGGVSPVAGSGPREYYGRQK